MSVVTTRARTTTVLLLTAALSTGAAPASAALPRPVAVHPTTVSATAAARRTEQQTTAATAAASERAGAFATSLGIDERWVRPGVGDVSSPYGMRTHPVTGAVKAHTGVDFQYADGLAYAAAEGTVADVRVDPAYGNLITISHGRRISTRYAHLAATSVVPGEHVSAGQVIGRIGSTGLSTGPHLHFEIQVNGHFHDPMYWLGGRAGIGTFRPWTSAGSSDTSGSGC